MQPPFNQVLTFYFNHNYFSDKLFKSLEISLGEETSHQMRNLGIIVKPFPGGFYLLSAEPELLKNKNETTPLRIYLYCKDHRYINYTNLPGYSPADNILYFNNLAAKFAPDSHCFYLHSSEFTGENNVVRLSSGRIKVTSFNPGKEYHFNDVAGFQIPPQNIISNNNQNGEFTVSGIPEGRIGIMEKDAEVDNVYFNPKQVWKKPFAIAEIFTNTLLNHFNEKGKVEYRIQFENRATIWKYFLVDPVYQKFNNLTIINKGKEQVFKSPQKQRINENLEAVVFESKNKIPIAEYSIDTHQLVDKFDPKEKTGNFIIRNLPSASPEILYHGESNSDETFYSHIYI